MAVIAKKQIQISTSEISKLLNVYNTIGEFLDKFVDRQVLYKDKFINGLELSIKEVEQKKTQRVKNFTDFIS